MKKENCSALSATGPSICYGCRHYDWSIIIGAKGGQAWQHECTSPGEHVPGDDVLFCFGFSAP